MTLSDVIETLVVAANLGMFLLIVLTVAERLRDGWRSVELQVQDVIARREQAEKDQSHYDEALSDERKKVADLDQQIARARSELESLEMRHAETDLPFIYTATPIEGVDPRFPPWRLVVHNPQLGQRAMQLSDAAYQWNEGRYYEVPAPTHAAARAHLERLLPPQDSFFVRIVDDERSGVA
ncbi:hypothetical protein [Ferrovibrio sp.]|uniref:hypothetical protein n=1 Tax=Ferrovibrio sp. TaxID=1917215 RepID=UPI001B73784C|nr:hypothetical protein [Ferrovibrio sp.]MBP7066475.1 hypothetical protein [Ferrovibrio sp.]